MLTPVLIPVHAPPPTHFPIWWAADPGMEGSSRALNGKLPGQQWSLPRRFTPSFMTARINNDQKYLFPVSPSDSKAWTCSRHQENLTDTSPHCGETQQEPALTSRL